LKRHGNLWSKICDPENIYAAYRAARKSKGNRHCVQTFEKNLDANLAAIRESLLNKTFHTAKYTAKEIFEPKRRTIYVLPFAPDRIVQHALMRVVEPIWDKLMIHDSYACRKGKGIHSASTRVGEYIRKNDWALQCDIAKFYPSVNHDTAFAIIQQKIKCPDTLWLLRDIIYSMPGGCNVPIGNYTSQWIGNLYLNELDQVLKHEHKVKNYLRYCDDFILFGNDKARLHQLSKTIETFCRDHLQMRLSYCSLYPVSQGVDFVGYRHFRTHVLLRKSTVKRVRKRLRMLPWLYKNRKINLDQFRSSIASTIGWFKWANTRNLQIAVNLKQLQIEVEKECCENDWRTKTLKHAGGLRIPEGKFYAGCMEAPVSEFTA